MTRDERGLGVVEALIVLAAVLAAAGTMGTLISIATSDSYGGSNGPHIEQPITLLSFPVPGSNDCTHRVQDMFKDEVKFDPEQGWLSTDLTRPTPPPRPPDTDKHYLDELKDYNKEVLAYNGQAAKWNLQMRERMKSYHAQINEMSCNQNAPAITQPSANRIESPSITIAGTYSISWSGLNCPLDPQWEQKITAASVSGSPPAIQFTFIGGNQAGNVYPLTDKGGGSFEVSNEGATIHATFGAFGDKVQINGSYRYNGPEAQCSGLFSGLKN